MTIKGIFGSSLLLLFAGAVGAAETVRVDATSGAPRLLVDGKPVRARMFWGAPGTRPITVRPEGEHLEFEFSPLQDEPRTATMHFRFGQTAGSVDLDDIRVQDLTTGEEVLPSCHFESGAVDFSNRWSIWPPGEMNTVGRVEVRPQLGSHGSGSLHVELVPPADKQWPDFHIHHRANLSLRRGHRYRVSFWGRAKPARDLTIGFYRPGTSYVFLGGPSNGFEDQIRMAGEAGAPFVSFPVDMPWPPPGQPIDWSIAEGQCQAVLAANPQALLLPRIGMDAPEWWLKAHPDDVMVWDSDPQFRYAVVASPSYQRDAAERLSALVTHLEQKFGPHMAGYHPCGQNTGEWFYQETWGKGLNGYAPADLRAWRAWLKSHYESDERLRKAWNLPQITLDTATVPTPLSRRNSPAGVLRDPVLECPAIDFAEFQQEAMADCVCHLARAVHQAVGGRKLVVFFYGYVFEFGAVANGPSTSGHYALRRVLQCPAIDVLCSPISYIDRGLGQSAPSMTAAESVALAGKMWLNEDDTRTYLGTGQFPGWVDGVDTLEKTNQELLRNTGQCALRNFGTWWMDLGASGWFNDSRMWAEMKRLGTLDERLLAHPRPFRPDVAAVIDERAMMRVAAGGNQVSNPAVCQVRRALGRMGAPYGQYLQDDVLGERVNAKLFVLLSPWCLTSEERQQLIKATSGSFRIWCYAPGYQQLHDTSLDAMRELTGFRLKNVTSPKAWAVPTMKGRELGLTEAFGVDGPITPLFAAVDATAEEILATYPDGSAAVAMRRSQNGGSLFVGPPGLTPELLRLAAHAAGVHLFTQRDCNVYANGPYLILHASQDGPLEIDTGGTGTLRDLLDGRALGKGPQITLPLKKGETRVMAIGDD